MNRWWERPMRRAPSPLLLLVTVLTAVLLGFCSGVTYANGVLN